MSLGFKQADAKVYVLLRRNGNQKASDIAEMLGIHKRQVYRSLNNLQIKGVVSKSAKRPARFSATRFEKILDALIKANVEEAKNIEQNKKELFAKWQKLIRE